MVNWWSARNLRNNPFPLNRLYRYWNCFCWGPTLRLKIWFQKCHPMVRLFVIIFPNIWQFWGCIPFTQAQTFNIFHDIPSEEIAFPSHTHTHAVFSHAFSLFHSNPMIRLPFPVCSDIWLVAPRISPTPLRRCLLVIIPSQKNPIGNSTRSQKNATSH